MTPGFTGHPERRVIQRFIRIGLFPFRQRRSGLGFQLLPGSLLDVFGGIDAEAVNAVITYPLTQPVGQIIARRIAWNHFCRRIRLLLIEIRQPGRGG